MSDKIHISSLFKNWTTSILIDVRSPGEYDKGHIPGAINMPLFSNEERAIVGTIYKQENPEAAMLKGLDFVGPKMSGFVKEAKSLSLGEKDIIVHCWRGGKRSQSVSWLLNISGLETKTLEGGYKAYRQFIRNQLSLDNVPLTILTGSTGSGKTKVLHCLKEKGEQIIDLEGIAHHKGSAFGHIDETEQPTTEQFENDLYEAIQQLDFTKRIWLESESRMIGNISLPDTFWNKMNQTSMIHLKIDKAARVEYLVKHYGKYPKEELVVSFLKLKKKLAQNLKLALEALETDDLGTAAKIALDYYDKYYNKHLSKNEPRIIKTIEAEEMNFEFICNELLAFETV